MLRNGWVVLVVAWAATAAPAQAQFVCSGGVCFTSEEACEERRVHQLDEGERAPPCTAAQHMYCVDAFDEIEGESTAWCHPTRATCAGRIRDLQRLNRRSHRHLYSHIGTCVELEYDADGDGVRWDMDECDDQPGTASTRGCPDGDGDGWSDVLDRCPLIAGALYGCPDADQDGVPDSDDRCPDVRGMVSLDGCLPPEPEPPPPPRSTKVQPVPPCSMRSGSRVLARPAECSSSRAMR